MAFKVAERAMKKIKWSNVIECLGFKVKQGLLFYIVLPGKLCQQVAIEQRLRK